MALYYGRHKVQNYKSWRPIFDADQDRLAKVGAKLINVMQSADDPNNVHFIFDIPDLQAVMAELHNPETQAVMQQAGVLEPPVMFKLEDLSAPN